jgi:cytochrome P450
MNLLDVPLLSGATRTGHLDELRDDRHRFLHRVVDEGGDLTRILALGTSLLFANGPDVLHEILVEKAKLFRKSPGIRGPLIPLAGDGLFTSEGELWRRQRKLLAPLFTHAEIARYAAVMASSTEDAARSLYTGQVFDAARLTTHVAMRVAGKALFDVDTLDEADELGAALTEALSWVNGVSMTVPYALQLRAIAGAFKLVEAVSPALAERSQPLFDNLIDPIRWPGEGTRRVEAALAVIDRRVERMIHDRRAQGTDGRRDLLSLLLGARDDEGRPMSDKQVRDEVVTLFIAGHETTASSLAWALYLLARHPEAHARARAEASVLASRPATFADLARLPYCLQVFKEAMRLYPPIYVFGRQSIAPVTVGGYDIPSGTVVIVSPYALQHRPDLWPDPDRFDPSRFEPAAEEARHRQAYIPFSAGPRTCIGNHFALMEGPIVLATLLARADLALATSSTIACDMSATLRPKGGVPMRVKALSASASAAAPAPPVRPDAA